MSTTTPSDPQPEDGNASNHAQETPIEPTENLSNGSGSSSGTTTLSTTYHTCNDTGLANDQQTDDQQSIITDPVLLQEVSEIVQKVRRLEELIRCEIPATVSNAQDVRLGDALTLKDNREVESVLSSSGFLVDSVSSLSSRDRGDIPPDYSCGNQLANAPSSLPSPMNPKAGDTLAGSGGDQEQVGRVSSDLGLSLKLEAREAPNGDALKGNGSEMKSTSEDVGLCPANSNNNNSGSTINNNNSTRRRSSPSTMNEEEIKALVKELKRKIEYTERMNWLCEYIWGIY